MASAVSNGRPTNREKYACAQLLCKVITGKRQPLHKEDFKRTQPDEEYDCTTSAREQCVTVYTPDQILPLAIIEYTVPVEAGEKLAYDFDYCSNCPILRLMFFKS